MSSSLSSVSSGASNTTPSIGSASQEKKEIEETAKKCFDNAIKESEGSGKKKKKKKKKTKNLTKDLATSSYYSFIASGNQSSEEFVFKVPIALFPQSIRDCLLEKPAPSIRDSLKKRFVIQVKSIKPEEFENLGGLDYKRKLKTKMPLYDIVFSTVINFLNTGREGMDSIQLVAIDRALEDNTVSYQKKPLSFNALELDSTSKLIMQVNDFLKVLPASISDKGEKIEILRKFIEFTLNLKPTTEGEQAIYEQVMQFRDELLKSNQLPIPINIPQTISQKLEEYNKEYAEIIKNYNIFAERLASIFTAYNVPYKDRPSNIFSTIAFEIVEKHVSDEKHKTDIFKQLRPVFVDLNFCLKQIFNCWKEYEIEEIAVDASPIYEFYMRDEAASYFETKENQLIFNEQLKLAIDILRRRFFDESITASKNENIKAAQNELKKLYEPLYKWLWFLDSMQFDENKVDGLYYGSQLFEDTLKQSFICSRSQNIEDLDMTCVINNIKKLYFIIGNTFKHKRLLGLLRGAVNSLILKNHRTALYYIDKFSDRFNNKKQSSEQTQETKILDLEITLMLNELKGKLFCNLFGEELKIPIVEQNLKNLENAVKNLNEFSANVIKAENTNQSSSDRYQKWIGHLEEDHPLAAAFKELGQLQNDLQKKIQSTLEFNKSILEDIKNCSSADVKMLKNLHKEAHTWDHLLRLVKDKHIHKDAYIVLLRELFNRMYRLESEFVLLITKTSDQLKIVHDLTFIQYLVDVDSPNLPTLEQVQQTFKDFNQQIEQAASPLFAYFQANHDVFRCHEAKNFETKKRPELTLRSSFTSRELTFRPLKVKHKKFEKFESQVEEYKKHMAAKDKEAAFEIEIVNESVEESKEEVETVETQVGEEKTTNIQQSKKARKKQNIEPKVTAVPKASVPKKKQEKDPILEAADEIFSSHKPDEIVANLQRFLKNYDNWVNVNGKGSHLLIKINGVTVSIPMHKSAPTGTIKSMQRQFLHAFGYER